MQQVWSLLVLAILRLMVLRGCTMIHFVCLFSAVMHSPGPAFKECTGSCHENVPAPKAVSSVCDIDRWSDCIGYRIEIVCLFWYNINHPTTLHTHTMKPGDPLLLADGTLRCGMYPAGKVTISLATPVFPQCDHVQMLVHCVVKYSRPPNLKSSSNVSLPFSCNKPQLWIRCIKVIEINKKMVSYP